MAGTEPKGIHAVLVARLNRIPEGKVAEVARDGKIADGVVRRLRRGDQPDVKLSTLERLANGMGITAAELLSEGTHVPMPVKAQRQINPRVVRQTLKTLDALRGVIEKLAGELAALGDEREEAP